MLSMACMTWNRYARTLSDSRTGLRITISYFGESTSHKTMNPATPTHPLCVAEDSAAGEGSHAAPCEAKVNNQLLRTKPLVLGDDDPTFWPAATGKTTLRKGQSLGGTPLNVLATKVYGVNGGLLVWFAYQVTVRGGAAYDPSTKDTLRTLVKRSLASVKLRKPFSGRESARGH